MATMPNASAARQTLVLEAPPQSRRAANTLLQHQIYQQQQQQHQQHGGNSSSRSTSSNSTGNGNGIGGGPDGPSSNGTSPLEIAYSTISPKVDAQPPYPMHIKLSLIDQNVSAHGCVRVWLLS